jgi:hypothetical protein
MSVKRIFGKIASNKKLVVLSGTGFWDALYSRVFVFPSFICENRSNNSKLKLN